MIGIACLKLLQFFLKYMKAGLRKKCSLFTWYRSLKTYKESMSLGELFSYSKLTKVLPLHMDSRFMFGFGIKRIHFFAWEFVKGDQQT